MNATTVLGLMDTGPAATFFRAVVSGALLMHITPPTSIDRTPEAEMATVSMARGIASVDSPDRSATDDWKILGTAPISVMTSGVGWAAFIAQDPRGGD